MVFEMELKKYLLDLGVSKVGFADIDGLASDFLDLPNGISLILKLPKKCVDYIENDEYDKYWMLFHKTMAEITKIALLGEEFIKNKGYNAFALTMDRNECDMEKLLSILPLKTIATKSGLGWIGRSSLFVCEEYGSAVCLSGILTDMPLEFAHSIEDSYCDDCEECQDACPVAAINPIKWNSRLNRSDIIDIEVCSEYVIDQFRKGSGCSKCLSECKLTQEYYKKI